MSEQDCHGQNTTSSLTYKLLRGEIQRTVSATCPLDRTSWQPFNGWGHRKILQQGPTDFPQVSLFILLCQVPKYEDPNLSTELTRKMQEHLCWNDWKGQSTNPTGRGLMQTRRSSTLWETFNSTQWITRGEIYRIIIVTDCSKRKIIFTACSTR